MWIWRLSACFNTQPPEGGWTRCDIAKDFFECVSTHSRPKAAGLIACLICESRLVSTHSRPKAAGFKTLSKLSFGKVSTHSRPKAAGLRDKLTGRH